MTDHPFDSASVYEWSDAQELHRQYPDTFEVPDPSELRNLGVGDHVKGCLAHKERVWVLVAGVNGSQIYGTLDNEPVLPSTPGKLGELVVLNQKHVYRVFKSHDY